MSPKAIGREIAVRNPQADIQRSSHFHLEWQNMTVIAKKISMIPIIFSKIMATVFDGVIEMISNAP